MEAYTNAFFCSLPCGNMLRIIYARIYPGVDCTWFCIRLASNIMLKFTSKVHGIHGSRLSHSKWSLGSLQALNELLEVTRSDIRACLNALQFLSRRTSRVTVSGIRALGLASKDVTESAFTAWNQLFTIRVLSMSKESVVCLSAVGK